MSYGNKLEQDKATRPYAENGISILNMHTSQDVKNSMIVFMCIAFYVKSKCQFLHRLSICLGTIKHQPD